MATADAEFQISTKEEESSDAGVTALFGAIKIERVGGIVVGVDGSRLSYGAFDAAVRMRRPGEFLTALHIAKNSSGNGRTSIRASHEGVGFITNEFRLRGKMNQIPDSEFDFQVIHCGADEPMEKAIHHAVSSLEPELFVCGSFGRRGPSPFSKGRKTDLSLRSCKSSALIVKPETTIPLGPLTIMACVDGGMVEGLDRRIIDSVIERAKARDTIVLLHIASERQALATSNASGKYPKGLADVISRLDALKADADWSYKVQYEKKERRKTLAQQITETAQKVEAHITVVGVDRLLEYKTGSSLLGSVTDMVVRKVRTSLLLVK